MILIGANIPFQGDPFVHTLFECIGYSSVALIYKNKRYGSQPMFRTSVNTDGLVTFYVTVFFAMIGAIFLNLLENYSDVIVAYSAGKPLMPGKSILGGIIFGIIGVELIKQFLPSDQRFSTGNKWVLPLSVGIAIGRLGCLLYGMPDGTYGSPVPDYFWVAWDHGDGIGRYPVALFESIFTLFIGVILYKKIKSSNDTSGLYFNMFIAGYCFWRFWIEFLKPPFGKILPTEVFHPNLIAGLTAIQWFALISLLWMIYRIYKCRLVIT